VLRPGEALEIGELIRFCTERLTDYKVPDDIQVRPDLPHNILGKVLRRVLREEHTGETAPGPGHPQYPHAAEDAREPDRQLDAETGSGSAAVPAPEADGRVAEANGHIPEADGSAKISR
jgi:long-chain acyl-CoA synthetase